MSNKLKIIGFCQLRNELENGNLYNFLKCMDICCNAGIYIHDNNSTDGSKDVYKTYGQCRVTHCPVNDFENELVNKQLMLDKIKVDLGNSLFDDNIYLLWFDGDAILDARLLQNKLKYHETNVPVSSR